MSNVVKRIVGFPCRFGGEQHTGWLPAGAAVPLPTPVRDVLLDIEIEFDGYGYLLCYHSQDGTVHGDTWHQSLGDAEQSAAECFGVESRQWQPVEPTNGPDPDGT
jgi:hypothetical protein